MSSIYNSKKKGHHTNDLREFVDINIIRYHVLTVVAIANT